MRAALVFFSKLWTDNWQLAGHYGTSQPAVQYIGWAPWGRWTKSRKMAHLALSWSNDTHDWSKRKLVYNPLPHTMEGASSRCDHRPTLKSVLILYYNAISLLPKFDEPCAVAEAPVLMSFALLNPGCPMKFKTINELAIDNYQILRLNRNCHGGSVVMYIHSSLSYQVCQLEPKSWVLIVSVSTLYGKFLSSSLL